MHTLDSFCALAEKAIAAEHKKLADALIQNSKSSLAEVELARGEIRGLGKAINLLAKSREKFLTEDMGDF